MIYHVYKILCKSNKKFYIGMSQEYEKRWRAHKNQLRLGKHNNVSLQSDWLEYGEDDFEFSLLHEFQDSELCQQTEMSIINNSDAQQLYNIVKDTSIGGDVFSHNPRKEEIRQQKVDQMSGKNNHQYGKPKTEKMINSVKEANSKAVIIEGKEYPSLTEASEILKVKITTLCNRLKSPSERFKNWNYKNA